MGDFAARGFGAQHLGNEGPKRHRRRQAALTAVDALARRIQQLFGEQIAKDRVEILQAFEVLQTLVDLALGPSEKQGAKSVKEGGFKSHH